jgi:hypothetical protein
VGGSVAAVDQTLPAVDVLLAPAVRTPSELDLRMRRLLRIRESDMRGSERAARSAFEFSVYLSAARCLLTYIVLPFIFPIIGVTTRATPVVGITVSLVAMTADIASIRRFWRADHKYRWHYTALASTITVMMLYLVIHDVIALLT